MGQCCPCLKPKNTNSQEGTLLITHLVQSDYQQNYNIQPDSQRQHNDSELVKSPDFRAPQPQPQPQPKPQPLPQPRPQPQPHTTPQPQPQPQPIPQPPIQPSNQPNQQSNLKSENFLFKNSFRSKYNPTDAESENVKRIINQIYDMSCRKRYTEGVYSQFVRQKEDFQELCKNYSFKTSTVKSQLKKICNSYRPARGDGNCFYTAFGYRFLEILLLQYDQDQFESFLQKANQIPFKINLEGYKIDDYEIENQLRKCYLYRLELIRNINDVEERENQLHQQYSASEQVDQNIDGCLYGLNTIFFRNLSFQIIQNIPMRGAVFDIENLLLWETECNSNEVIIKALAEYLNIHIQLLFIEQNEFKLMEYSPECQNKIILLIRPGHYNMGYY